MFIAIELPDDIKTRLSELQDNLKTGSRFVDAHPRWVAADNLHLTLVFIGAVQESHIDLAKEAMDQAGETTNQFEILINRLGLFPPDSKNPKVISLDVKAPQKALQRLYDVVNLGLRRRGFDIETRPYRPHLTLARLTSIKTAARMGPLVASHSGRFEAKFPATDIVLYESHLGGSSPVYNVLHRTVLTNENP